MILNVSNYFASGYITDVSTYFRRVGKLL